MLTYPYACTAHIYGVKLARIPSASADISPSEIGAYRLSNPRAHPRKEPPRKSSVAKSENPLPELKFLRLDHGAILRRCRS